jgi:4'-phosphopantetheinyl transferase
VTDVRFLRIDTADIPACEQLLSGDERRRAETYRADEDRIRFVAARAALRTILSELGALPPSAWRFGANEFGKPHIAPEQNPLDLRFSVSHSGTLVALAVATGADVGIDVEALSRGAEILPVAARFFAPAEQEELAATPPAERPRRAVELWTAKEALLKSRGTGLHATLAAASLHGVPVHRWLVDSTWLAALINVGRASARLPMVGGLKPALRSLGMLSASAEARDALE